MPGSRKRIARHSAGSPSRAPGRRAMGRRRTHQAPRRDGAGPAFVRDRERVLPLKRAGMPGAEVVAPVQALSRALMADSEHGVLLVDPQGRVASINAVAARLLGRAAARANGRGAAELLRTVVAGDDVVAE